MAPSPHDPVSATTLKPALCGYCPNLATITCSGCDNMRYCSTACQQSDSAQHNTLCSTFQNFQERPSDDHYRSIYFPLNERRPRFIWLRFTGSRGVQEPDSDHLARYIAEKVEGRFTLQKHHELDRSFSNLVIIEYDDSMYDCFQPFNQCLLRMIGIAAERWRGDYVAHGQKYLDSDDMDAVDAGDQDLVTDDLPMIALDLDTTSLGPIVAYLKWHEQNDQDHFSILMGAH